MARAFEAMIEIEIVAGNQRLGHTYVMTSAGAPTWGAFDTSVPLELPAGVDSGADPVIGAVRVFSRSMKDGSIIDLVSVPVRILLNATQNPTPATRVVKVYFARIVENQLAFVPVDRTIPWTLGVGRAALGELLKGPTPQEKASGLVTSIPTGTKLLSLRIENGVAYADFDRTLQKGAQGSAAIYEMVQSIRLTLFQFTTVQQVVISVEGQTEGILEP